MACAATWSAEMPRLERVGRRCFPLTVLLPPVREPLRERASDAGVADLVEFRELDYRMLEGTFDRVVSVEMFEHLRNWPQMFGRVHDWLKPGGHFFMHVFCHRNVPYEFVDGGESDWMSRHFFSGGMMPSDELRARYVRAADVRVRGFDWDTVVDDVIAVYDSVHMPGEKVTEDLRGQLVGRLGGRGDAS